MISSPAYSFHRIERKNFTIEEFEEWMRWNISYKAEPYGEDYWQCPTETINLKRGDCEDMGILYSAFLTSKGINNFLVCLISKGQREGHAVTMWRNEKGIYMVSSNNKVFNTRETTIQGAIQYCNRFMRKTITRAVRIVNKEKWYEFNPEPQPPKICIDIPLKNYGGK